jgi:hypothetical protein
MLAEVERVIVEAELHLMCSLEYLRQCGTNGPKITVWNIMRAAESRLAVLRQRRDGML